MNNITKRNLCFIASVIFSFAIPIITTIIRFDMYKVYMKASTKIKISILGCIIIIITTICNFKKIKEYIDSIDFSIWKCIMYGLFKMIPLVCISLLLYNMTTLIEDLRYVVYTTLFSNIFSLFIFDPLWKYYNEEVKYDKKYYAQRKRVRKYEEEI